MLKLIDIHISAHLLNPKDNLFITAKWQNTAASKIGIDVCLFVDFEYGYQRIPENICKKKRIFGEYAPQIARLGQNEITSTTLLYQVPASGLWAGEYSLYAGLCGKDGVPIPFLGENELTVNRQRIGAVDISWGWGRAVVELSAHRLHAEYNEAVCQSAEKQDTSAMQKTSTFTIEDSVKVTMQETSPVITGFEYKDFDAKFNPAEFEVILRDYRSDTIHSSYAENVETRCKLETSSKNSAQYQCKITVNKEQAAEFDISFAVRGNTLSIAVDTYAEYNGFELIEIRCYNLACLKGMDARLADLTGGGREVKAEGHHPMRYIKNYDVHNAAALYNSKGIIILEDQCPDNKLCTAVEGYGEDKYLSIGSVIALKICASNSLKSVEVPRSAVEISIFTDELGNPGWLAFCKYLRRNLKRCEYYDIHKQAIHYTIYCTQGPEPLESQVREGSPYEITRLNKGLKFSDILAEIKKLHNITDGYKQVPFIYGYYKQSDEEKKLCFDVYSVDHRAGSLNELRELIARSPEYNTEISLYENFDDIYETTTVDMKYAATDMHGNPWKGWIWADGESRAAGFRHYYESGEMQKRIDKMMEVYGKRKTGYVDVLSSEVLRWDFNPQYPSSAQTSLAYKKKIVEAYNKHGMDVYSETLVHPFAGHIGFAVSTRTDINAVYYENEKFYPMMNAIYHGTVGYCGHNCVDRVSFLKALLIGGSYRFEYDEAVSCEHVRWLYLLQMPQGMLEDEYLVDFFDNGGKVTLIYSNGCCVTIDEDKMEYEIIAHGRRVGKNWTTFVPAPGGGGYLAYSLHGGKMKYELPDGIDATSSVSALLLTFDGIGEPIEGAAEITNGHIIINMPPDRPIKVQFLQ